MSTHRHVDKICCAVIVFALILTALFACGESVEIERKTARTEYEYKLFDTSKVHTVDIAMDTWDIFLENHTSEEYSVCNIAIDEEPFKNVAIRVKGNTSLTQVAAYGNSRYSFKIEFDRYDKTNTYYSLDKLCLNNIIQDNTYMKDYLCYTLMRESEVAAPLCSYVYITVNGEDWGLYLAVEGIEDGFLNRNFSGDGELYKPDSNDMGVEKGNSGKSNSDNFESAPNQDINPFEGGIGQEKMQGNVTKPQIGEMPNMPSGEAPKMPNDGMPNMPNGGTPDMPGGETPNLPNSGIPDMPSEGMSDFSPNSSSDVLLNYIDDDPDSYPNIFDNAKTDITEEDKTRLINALKILNEGEHSEAAVAIEKVIDYFAVHNFVLNFDSYTGSMGHNYYLYENDGIMQMIPWDYNLAFGGFQSQSDATELVNYPIDTPVSGGSIETRPMLSWIFKSEEYTNMYHAAVSNITESFFDSGKFEVLMESTVKMISPFVEKDPTKFCTYSEFKKGADTLKEFCRLRAESIKKQLNGDIGSASAEQNADTFVRADGIQISDMGEMNITQSMPTGREDSASAESVKFPEGNKSQSNSRDEGENAPFGKEGTPSKVNLKPYSALALSVGVLAVGTVVALLYKRRKKQHHTHRLQNNHYC